MYGWWCRDLRPVRRDVRCATGAFVVGCPVRPLRLKLSEEVVQVLMKIRWCEWDDDRIREAIPLLSSDRIEEFLARYSPGADN